MTDATVIIAAWHAEEFLSKSVASALAQKNINIEIIIVDDASKDGTFSLAQDLSAADSRIRVLRTARNGGPAAARNMGIDAARGRWIAVLDSDDLMQPDRLKRMIDFGESCEAGLVYDDFQPVGPDARFLGSSHLHSYGLTAPAEWTLGDFLAGCQAESGRPSLGYLKPVFRASALAYHGVRYDESLRNGEDFHITAELLARGVRVWTMPEAGYLYRIRKGSISNRLDLVHAEALLKADAAFLHRNSEWMSKREISLMRRRQKRLSDLVAAETMIHWLRLGRPGPAVRKFAQRPRAAGRLSFQLFEAMKRRLT
ncbi:glycosyltransferase [Poseidonocella sp. HB161398]|uniref:glycosyltransferase family 2 protein n=1 Tax=Poseidonocella sp. HB161398 TaxID=2320855 RepID=UPI0011090B5F|nr:glycosyltransferase [Poseidonocella sp. HB161398]